MSKNKDAQGDYRLK